MGSCIKFGFVDPEKIAGEVYRISAKCLEELRSTSRHIVLTGFTVILLSGSVGVNKAQGTDFFSWDKNVVTFAIPSASTADICIQDHLYNLKKSGLYKSLISHGFHEMNIRQQHVFCQIDEILSGLPGKKSDYASFSSKMQSLSILMRFDKGVKLRIDRYMDWELTDDEPEDKNIYFTLSADGEILWEDALEIDELGQRLAIFFEKVSEI